MLYKSFLKHVALPLGSKLINQSVLIKKNFWEKAINQSKSELANFQGEQLETLLKRVCSSNEFYRGKNIRLTNDPYSDIKKFPILNKSLVNRYKNSIVKDGTNLAGLHLIQTSGSSGERGIAYVNKEELSSMRAIQLLWWEIAGYEIGTKIIQTGMANERSGIKLIKDKVLKTDYLKAFNCTEEFYLNKLIVYKNRSDIFLAGYASSIYVLSEVNRKYNLNINPYSIIVWGDKLFDHYRRGIESSFNTKVHETYAVSEGFMVGFQKDLSYMYQMSPQTYIEILDEKGQEVEDGEIGFVHLTRLDAFAFPLIRYKVGDLAIKLPYQEYPTEMCYNLPLLKKVIGRETDIITNDIGEKLVVHYFTGIFEYIEEIKQFKVVQESDKDLNIHIISNRFIDDSVKNKIVHEINKNLKSPFKIRFTEVENIPTTKSGKPQIIEIIK